jgi:predicted NAD/FAD-dependent oxidoreductase
MKGPSMADPDVLPLDGKSVAVIGAGMAGLTAARKLAKAGAMVTVFEKSRGCGGRLATRRIDGGAADHGAQYFTAREPGFKAWVARAKLEGAAGAWTPRGKDSEDEWLVGLPGMSQLVDALIDGFKVAMEHQVTSILSVDGRFVLSFKDTGDIGGFERVVVAVPAPQAEALIGAFGAPFDKIGSVVMAPCWALIAGFDQTVDPGFDMRRGVDALQWIARSLSKPGRAGEIWLAQASPDWSRRHLEEPAETVIPVMLGMLEKATGPLPTPVFLTAHRWRYALVEKAVGETFLMSPDGLIGVCGDWLIAPRVEAAWASGDGLADALIAKASAE